MLTQTGYTVQAVPGHGHCRGPLCLWDAENPIRRKWGWLRR